MKAVFDVLKVGLILGDVYYQALLKSNISVFENVLSLFENVIKASLKYCFYKQSSINGQCNDRESVHLNFTFNP